LSSRLYKSTLSVSIITLLSRILGFVRDMLIARIFGVDLATDAFFVAFKIPNFLRRLFTEGAFSHAFLPILEDYQANGDQHATKGFIDRSAGCLALVLLIISILGIIAAPILISILAPGYAWHSPEHALAAQLLQICLPYLLFIGLVAFAGGILNAYGQFIVPALTPALLNVAMIGAAIFLAPLLAEPVSALAWGVVIAGIAQLTLQLPALQRLGLLPRLRIDFNHAGIKRLFKQLLPAVLSVSITQINLLLDTLIASLLAAGSVSWLYYSDRLVEFPLGILGMGLATVILPKLAKCHAMQSPEAFSSALDWGIRLLVLMGIPATIGLVLLAEPMLSTLFQYHEFTATDVHLAGQSLKAYALGLIGYLLIKVLVSGFTARHDMKTPVRYGIYAMLTSLALNVLAIPLAHAGLALATSLGALLNALLLLNKLRRDKVYKPESGWWCFLLRISIASLVMAGLLYYCVDVSWWHDQSATNRILGLLLWITAAMASYAVVLVATGLRLSHLVLTDKT